LINGLAQGDRMLIRFFAGLTSTGPAHSAADYQFSLFCTKSESPRPHAVVRPWNNPQESWTSAEFSLWVDGYVLRDPSPVSTIAGQHRRAFVSAGIEHERFGVERTVAITVIDTEVSPCGVPWSQERPWKW